VFALSEGRRQMPGIPTNQAYAGFQPDRLPTAAFGHLFWPMLAGLKLKRNADNYPGTGGAGLFRPFFQIN